MTTTRILLIDDDAVDRMTVRRALDASDLTCELIEAADGASGLARAREGVFDCVLLDYRLPDVDAFDLLADLLSPGGGAQSVLMLTGQADPDAALRLMRAGALDHLSKGELGPSMLSRAIRYAKARRAFLDELAAARREAEEKSVALDSLNRQKSLLLSIIAHDLRNPFQLLLGLSDMLSAAVASRTPEAVERRAQGIKQAAEQAYALMEGLFSWASLQMDSVAVTSDDLDLTEVATEAVAGCQVAAQQKGISLTIACDGLRVASNRDMLKTILRNLVGNAVKFTPEGGRIAISGRADADGMLAVSVADTGVGMTAGQVDRLFKVDHRATTIGTSGERGSGLGLLLCRDLAERLGSDLTVTSSVGEGTSFVMLLPTPEPR